MNIRGFYKFSLVDYPGRIACIVFTGGCNFRCPYCHNAALVVDPKSQPKVMEQEIFNFLEKRKGLLEGIVISGGEPTLQPDLLEFCGKVRELGYLIKLDTNSTNPEVVKAIHSQYCIDSLGLDVKAPWAKYGEVTSCADPQIAEKVQELIRYALAENMGADIRTTVHKSLLSEADIRQMYQELQALGVPLWTLQQYNPVEVIDDTLSEQPTYGDSELVEIAKSLGKGVAVRGTTGRVLL